MQINLESQKGGQRLSGHRLGKEQEGDLYWGAWVVFWGDGCLDCGFGFIGINIEDVKTS